MRIVSLAKASALAVGLSALISGSAFAAGSGGVTGPAFYAEGALYRTVGTPTDFTNTGAPDASFDTIYALSSSLQPNVASAAPGAPGFRGGRWMVRPLVMSGTGAYATAIADPAVDMNGNGVLDSAAEVMAGVSNGYLHRGGCREAVRMPRDSGAQERAAVDGAGGHEKRRPREGPPFCIHCDYPAGTANTPAGRAMPRRRPRCSPSYGGSGCYGPGRPRSGSRCG